MAIGQPPSSGSPPSMGQSEGQGSRVWLSTRASIYKPYCLSQHRSGFTGTNSVLIAKAHSRAQVLLGYFNESENDGAKSTKCNPLFSHAKQAQERIQEFNRLKKARHLLDAVSLTNDLLEDGSYIEILSLANTVIKRFKVLGVLNTPLENSNEDSRSSTLKPIHTGIYHCCTFCSSGGKKEATCGCGGTMPGGYKGCGHGHIGHPGVSHWSCCGSILHYGRCLGSPKSVHQLLL